MLRNYGILLIILLTLMGQNIHAANKKEQLVAAKGVINRLLKSHADNFELKLIPKENGKDLFELESKNGKIIVSGSTGVAITSGVNWYLKYYCNCHFSWNGNQLNLPKKLPVLTEKVCKNTPYNYRYAFNYCTHSYTMAFWDWKRWEKEIDWLALNGVNMPLAITGQEAVWQQVYREMGLSDADIGKFLVGPAYFGWGWMGNVDGWGGPLPQSWIDSHKLLQKKILKRQRALGMTPVLPAFTGHVPQALTKKFPQAKIRRMRGWGGFPGTYVLDPMDPLFRKIGKQFIQTQTEIFGTDHYYSADTFNEMDPPSGDLKYLADVSKAVYQSMADGDPKAVNVMQGWLFLHGHFWKQDRIKAYLDAVPNGRMIILDLFATAKPQWKRTEAFHGKPYIWCMLNNWGGKQGMYGRSTPVSQELPSLLHDKAAGNLQGIGLSPEGLLTNPFIYDLMTEMTWHDKPVDMKEWTKNYIRRRYGKTCKPVEEAWEILRTTLYDCRTKRHGPQGSQFCMRPTPTFSRGSFVRSEFFYKPEDVRKALVLFFEASDELKDSETYRHDLVDLARQVMSDFSQLWHRELDKAYRSKNLAEFKKVSTKMLNGIQDLDKLLQTSPHFLLGKWLEKAKKQGTNPQEKNLYEWNARTLITLWGGKNSPLHDYAQKQWAGLMSDFYYPRWKMLFEMGEKSLKEGKNIDMTAYNNRVKNFEVNWGKQTQNYPFTPKGDTIKAVENLINKYVK